MSDREHDDPNRIPAGTDARIAAFVRSNYLELIAAASVKPALARQLCEALGFSYREVVAAARAELAEREKAA